MPTDNPKISAYVPQLVYDTFKQFQDERGISMSQAVIVILAEYFGIQQELKEFIEGSVVGGVTLSRIEEIEQSIEQLTLMFHENNSLKSELDSSLLSNLNNLIDKVPRIEERLDQLEYWKDESKKFDERLEKLKESPVINEVKEETNIQQKQESLEKSSEKSQLELIGSLLSELGGNLPIEVIDIITPLNAITLSQRIFCHKDTIARYKKSKSTQEFIEWTKEKDSDNIGWLPNPEGKGFIPESSTSSELLSRLQVWIENNTQSASQLSS